MRKRRGELRGHLASLVATQMMAGMAVEQDQAINRRLARRLGNVGRVERRGGVLIVRRDGDDVDEPVSVEHVDGCKNADGDYRPPVPCDCGLRSANALQRDEAPSVAP